MNFWKATKKVNDCYFLSLRIKKHFFLTFTRCWLTVMCNLWASILYVFQYQTFHINDHWQSNSCTAPHVLSALTHLALHLEIWAHRVHTYRVQLKPPFPTLHWLTLKCTSLLWKLRVFLKNTKLTDICLPRWCVHTHEQVRNFGEMRHASNFLKECNVKE